MMGVVTSEPTDRRFLSDSSLSSGTPVIPETGDNESFLS